MDRDGRGIERRCWERVMEVSRGVRAPLLGHHRVLGVVRELCPPLEALKSQLRGACGACDLSPAQALAVFFLDC